MRRIISALLIFFCLLLMNACSQSTSADAYENLEDAVKFGLQSEGAHPSDVMAVEEFQDETIIFYEFDGTLGVASISKTENGYRWFRGGPYLAFENNDSDSYSAAGFFYETEQGLEVPIMYGQIRDNGISKILLADKGIEKELQISGDSLFYFAIHEAPFSSLEITPVRE
ncbi:hypothetical protein [Alkalicoccus daliensis]|uniref:Uncharacterized protein n=1 Tax=Alkalicoccus daliensis TaxID=745820 RepID=A0A1H0GZG6_9BACI|nr:hypothetical protein [Alkalicoccus daliensis]SDO12275.1 hypothetical protein SAMN04488053_107108 [Alkalicoccus daliensis]